MLDFDISGPIEFSGLIIVKGLVVTKASVVRVGSQYKFEVPLLDKTQAAFKQLMGIKKKRVVVDDESEKSVKAEDSDDDEDDELSDASEETDAVESDND